MSSTACSVGPPRDQTPQMIGNPSTESVRSAETADDLDFWIALAAGEQVWADPGEPIDPITRATAGIEILALFMCVTVTWIESLASTNPTDGFDALAPWIVTAASLFMLIRPFRLILGVRHAARLWPSFASRLVISIAIVAGTMSEGALFGIFALWPFAVALGAEAALCAWVLGNPIDPWQWWKSFMGSALHLGIVGAVVASILYLGAWNALSIVAPVYIALQLCVVGGALSAAALDRFRTEVETATTVAVAAAAAAEHRQSAHWLHDDVSAELKLVELRLRDEAFGPGDVADALADLDHQLRLRQLDELFQSGTVRLAEVLQPFVRDAQRHGLEITAVPTFDDASTIVDQHFGRLFARAASVATNNSIHAGATRLGFAVHTDDDTVVLSITDNAGGFELSEVPAGRGLWQLGQELGTGNISVASTTDGATVTISMQRSRGTHHGPTPTG